ncbi:MAG: YerC/YecD family TrpR-related protein [Lachnospirales bacterium]
MSDNLKKYNYNDEDIQILVDLILLIDNEEDCKKFLAELLSKSEFTSITQRIKIAHMLQDGKKYHEITETTKASTTTISRVNKVLSTENNMFYVMLKKLNKMKKLDK